MKKYMKSMNNEKREEKPVENNKVEIKEKPTNESKSFREILKEEGQTVKQGRVAYGISGLLIVALLLSTVVMLNNYGELKNIKQTLAGYSMDEEARVVNQMLNGEDATTQLTTVNQTTTIGRETEPVTQEPESTEIETTSMIEKMTTKSKQKPVNNNVTGTTYTVKKGQTLYDISMKVYGTSQMVEEIRKYNDIDEDYKIIEGQKIKLP